MLEKHILLKFELVLIKKKGKKWKGETYEEHWASLKVKVKQFITKAFVAYR
jgi:hypothetical protein